MLVSCTPPLGAVVELAAAVSRGEVSQRKAIEGFVRLVLARAPLRVRREAAEAIADVLANDEILSARFEKMFRRLASRARGAVH